MQQAMLIEAVDPNAPVPEQAFLTDDSVEILRFAAHALTAGRAAALVTLVDVRGGAARPVGAQMAVRADGGYCGYVSGGCVEAAAAFEAMAAMKTGRDRRVRYGEGSPYFDIVLPCGGSITLDIHVLRTARPLLKVLHTLEQRRPAGLRYTPQWQRLQSIQLTRPTGWHHASFDIGYRPCVRLVIYGHSVEAQVTANLAQAAGYQVQTGDSLVSQPANWLDADTAVVLLWHDIDRELPALQAAMAAKPFYIGALGSQRTHDRRVERLSGLGWSGADIARIKAPIGIFAKARDAQSLALSILADVAAARLVPTGGEA